MTAPTFAYINQLSQGSIIASTGSGTAEIAYPQTNVFTRLLGRPWRSKYQSFSVSANNNRLDFTVTIGGTTGLVAATVPTGDYRGEELATAVATAMNTIAGTNDIVCSYNRENKSFTISKPAGFLYIKWATGANKANSIGTTLFFVTSADVGGATPISFTSELDARSTGGIYRIDSTNNILYYADSGNKSCTIPVAVYTAAELAAEIKYQMDTTSSVSNFHVNCYPTLYGSYRWRFSRVSGTFGLRQTQTTTAIWDTLGFISGGSDLTGSQAYVGSYSRIHSANSSGSNEGEGIVIDLGGAVNLRWVGAMGSNVQAAGTGGTLLLKLQANATDSWATPTFDSSAFTASSYDRANKKSWFYWDLGAGQSFRYWRIQIVNNDNPDGYVQIGNLFGGVMTTVGSLGGFEWEFPITKFVNTESEITDMGAIYGTIKASLNELPTLTFPILTQTEYDFLLTMLTTVENISPFYFIPNATFGGSDAIPKVWYCIFMERPQFQPFYSGTAMRYKTVLKIIESA